MNRNKAQYATLIVFIIFMGILNVNYQNLSAHTKKNPGPHVHGHAELDIAIEGPSLEISFTSPADDILGFEHEPKDDVEKKTVEQTKDLFLRTFDFVELPKEAQCKNLKKDVNIDFPSSSEKADEDAATDHAEVEVELKYTCLEIKKLTVANFLIFKRFPTIKNIKVQVVNEDKQFSETLTPKKTNIKINDGK